MKQIFAKIGDYMGLVKFSHTIFAMPFALMAFVFALKTANVQFSWILLLQIVGCMVFARNVAMGFNRWTDWKIDSKNPRTASREIPAGKNLTKKRNDFCYYQRIALYHNKLKY